ncbi:MAG: hypothetical protein WC619_01115 [Patescibacteria group bacterium]
MREEIKAPTGEAKKRQPVFTKPRTIVLVKVLGIGPVLGVEEKKRDDTRIETAHTAEATRRGLNPGAYRRKADTGYCLFQKKTGVRITNLVAELQALGLKYTGCFYQKMEGKSKPVQTFQFSAEGDALPIPPAVKDLLANYCFADCSVWCNLRYKQDGPGQFRLDTVNLTGPYQPKPTKTTAELGIDGNTYRLV